MMPAPRKLGDAKVDRFSESTSASAGTVHSPQNPGFHHQSRRYERTGRGCAWATGPRWSGAELAEAVHFCVLELMGHRPFV